MVVTPGRRCRRCVWLAKHGGPCQLLDSRPIAQLLPGGPWLRSKHTQQGGVGGEEQRSGIFRWPVLCTHLVTLRWVGGHVGSGSGGGSPGGGCAGEGQREGEGAAEAGQGGFRLTAGGAAGHPGATRGSPGCAGRPDQGAQRGSQGRGRRQGWAAPAVAGAVRRVQGPSGAC